MPLWGIFIILLHSACAPGSDNSSHAPLPASHWFAFELGGHSIRVQLAVTDEERQRGLMGRREMAEDEGMLFVFSSPAQQSFWMVNTYLPLDIGYFSGDGVLREIYPMYPHNRESVRSNRHDIQYCLEMNQGWFRRHEVRRGTPLDLATLADALRQRGFDPQRYVSASAIPD